MTKRNTSFLERCDKRFRAGSLSLSCDPSGGLAQLARAPALQAGGQRFESVILHVVHLARQEVPVYVDL